MKENLTIYLIGGKARHGKTTSAHIIKDYYESHGSKAVITSYAKYIKMYVKELTDWDGRDETKPRELLQRLGTEVIREKLGKPEFFVKRIDEDMDVYNEFVNVVIIDDCRLPIEMDYFKKRYPDRVVTIHIDRPNFSSELSDSEKRHKTETGLDGYNSYDIMIENDGDLETLKEKICKQLK